jgi:hypothetical protein
MNWAGYAACIEVEEEERNANRFLVGKPEGRRPLERSRHRWKNNIKMDL